MTSRLEKKLRSVKELKQEHDYQIGTEDAWNYLKANEKDKELRDEIVKELRKKEIKYQPTVREISNLCEDIKEIIETAFDATSASVAVSLKAEEDIKTTPYTHKVLRFNSYLPLSEEYLWLESEEGKVWNFDYKSFLVKYFSFLINNKEEAFRKTVSETIEEKVHCLEDKEGNKKSFPELKYKDLVMTFEQALKFSDEEMIKEDLVYAVGKMIHFDDWINGTQSLIAFNSKIPKSVASPTQQELCFLYKAGEFGRGIYERAEREHNLNRLHIERRIALNEILKNYNEEADVDKSIKEKIDELKASAERYRKRIKDLEHLNDSWFLDKQEKSLEKISYKIRAVSKNRRWLKKVLSN